ncbi:hypothetical protein CCYA_CCYA01G0177 [Cyanidiococcus yangmingshanensis]|nr:hypothetical protein CCYA_CCYA01G0177 [Cyanidiococcus yangmingshanensis]
MWHCAGAGAGAVTEDGLAAVTRCAEVVLRALDLDTEALVDALQKLISCFTRYEGFDTNRCASGEESQGAETARASPQAHESLETLTRQLLAIIVSCERSFIERHVSESPQGQPADTQVQARAATLDKASSLGRCGSEPPIRRLVEHAARLIMAWYDYTHCSRMIQSPRVRLREPAMRFRKRIGVVVLVGGITGPAFVRFVMQLFGGTARTSTESHRLCDADERKTQRAVFFQNENIEMELVGVSLGPMHLQRIHNVETITSIWQRGAEIVGAASPARSTAGEVASVWSQMRVLFGERLRKPSLDMVNNGPKLVCNSTTLDGIIVVDTSNVPHAASLAQLVEDFRPRLHLVTGNAISLAAPEDSNLFYPAVVNETRFVPGEDAKPSSHRASVTANVPERPSSLLLAHPAVRCEAALETHAPLLSFLRRLALARPDAVCVEASMSPGIGHVFQLMQRGWSFSAAVREARSNGWIESWDCREELSGIRSAVKAIICARVLGFSDLSPVLDARVCTESLYDESRQSMSGCDPTCVEHRLRCSRFVGCRTIFEYIPSTYLSPPGHAEEQPESDENMTDLHPFMTSHEFLDGPDGILSLDAHYSAHWREAKANGCVLRYLVRLTGVYEEDTLKHGSVECPDRDSIRFVHMFGEQRRLRDPAPISPVTPTRVRVGSNASVRVGLAQVDQQQCELGRGLASDFVAVVKWYQDGRWHRAHFRSDGLQSSEITRLMFQDMVQFVQQPTCW